MVLERVHYCHVVKNLVISNGHNLSTPNKIADTAHTGVDASVTRPFARFFGEGLGTRLYFCLCVNSVFSMQPKCLHSLHPVASPSTDGFPNFDYTF